MRDPYTIGHDLLAACLACTASALALPWVAARAGRLGLVDVPQARSTHTRPVPRVGGLALACGLIAGLAGLGHATLDDADAWTPYLLPALGFLLLGLLDDRLRLRARWKFGVQAALAALAVGLGLRWEGQGLGPFGALTFGGLTPFLSWLWIIAVVTLCNLLDGLDLLTALGAVVVFGAGAGGGAGPGSGSLYLIAGAAVLGFAPWNLKPARAFPGDAATHLLGFLTATLALEVREATVALPWALASAPLLPGTIDVAWGLVQKLRHGAPLAAAHDQHLSQRLARALDSHARVAVRYALLALAGLLLVAWVAPRLGLAAALAAGVALLVAHLGSAYARTRGLSYRFTR